MPPKPKSSSPATNAPATIASTEYPAKRKNIPHAGLEAQGVLQEVLRQYQPKNLATLAASFTDDQP